MNALGVMIRSSLCLPTLTTHRQELVEKQREHTSHFTEVIEISSDEEERCFSLSAPGQSVCEVLTNSSESVLPI